MKLHYKNSVYDNLFLVVSYDDLDEGHEQRDAGLRVKLFFNL